MFTFEIALLYQNRMSITLKDARVIDEVNLVGSGLGQLEDELGVLQKACRPAHGP